jgi:hypothetical protein
MSLIVLPPREAKPKQIVARDVGAFPGDWGATLAELTNPHAFLLQWRMQ